MLKKMTLEDIAAKNPTVDLEKLQEWRQMGQDLRERGMQGRRMRGASTQDPRARIIDDAESDSRLITLRK